MRLEDLYRQVIMDHYKNPRNKGLVNSDDYVQIHLHNPSCGDDIIIEIKIEDETIKSIRHAGNGCSICCSSASVMSQTLEGKKIDEAKIIVEDFYEMIQGNPLSEEKEEQLGEALAYKGVSQFPARIKCATLAWKACEKALEDGESDE